MTKRSRQNGPESDLARRVGKLIRRPVSAGTLEGAKDGRTNERSLLDSRLPICNDAQLRGGFLCSLGCWWGSLLSFLLGSELLLHLNSDSIAVHLVPTASIA